ncbi:phosphopantetheine adenylyltransferase [Limnobacter humi]|uniref:Phosphopantetheine adenylyltransferase n=1 Tax=Limnobacter humi TaxID=1778671 RepID=A0ABT1WH45_9BURK|nr:phosphopantetheine adenylyltransferase [Limnobacter humi]MCQ8896833.1 phosphopantetheine adenylyltransferase [Limnobacter humi]
MSSTISAICITLLGLIHLLPSSGVLGPERLSRLYGIPIDEPNLEILMRHRAALFAVLGLFLIGAAWHPDWQTLAYWAAGISVLSFVAIAHHVGHMNPAMHRVMTVDWLAVLILIIGFLAHVVSQP